MSELREKIISGVFWQFIGRYSALVIQFFVTVILARLLTPNNYGTIAILNVFITISSILVESGFGTALIQKGNPSNRDFSTIFFFNLLISIIIYSILFYLLPLIGIFYENEALNYYGKILFLIIPISSIGIVQNTILLISLNFKHLSLIQIFSAFISGIIGVYFAYRGYGIASLVYHSLSLHITKTVLLIIINRWLPIYGFSFKTIKELSLLSFSLLSTDLIKVIFNNIYTLVIGKTYTADDVGYYNQASRLQEISANTITDVVISVTFPALVQIQNDRDRVKEIYSQVIQTVVILLVPITLVLFLLANEVITIVFSSKWLSAATLFQILCIYASFLPLHLINSNILKVYGEGKKIVKLEMCRRLLLSVAIIASIRISIPALLIGQIIAIFPIIIISMYLTGKLINFSVKDQLKEVVPYYAFSLIAFTLTYSIHKYLKIDSILLVIVIISCVYFTIYITLNVMFPTKYVTNWLCLIRQKIF